MSPRTSLSAQGMPWWSRWGLLGLVARLALASVSLPEPYQPELLKEGDEALQDAVDPVHQTEVDANSLQGGEGEQANPKGHEPVCVIVITHQQGPDCKAENDKVEKLVCEGREGGEFTF